jgi:formamidopyrimidine-DNA glycosylase
MPELPEVEAARRLVERVATGRTILRVRCAADPIVFESLTPAQVRRALHGRRILAAHRHGKHLWLELDRRPWPVIHFGMTGGFHAPDDDGIHLVSAGHRAAASWPPRFTKLLLTLDGDRTLALTDARRLGRVRLRHDPPAEPPVSLLGFDALNGLPSPRRFAALLAERRAPIKAVLLDQSFAAGVGNWVADEVLYQAGIDPRRPAHRLSTGQVRRLRAALRHVVRVAVGADADSDRFPRTWLFHRRWARAPGVTVRGERLRWATVGGRTTVWAPGAQR